MVKIIAEIAQAHEGSLGLLHSFIDALAATGVDAVKFQTHIAEAESSAQEPFRVNFSYEDATRYHYWKRMEFSVEQWKQIKDHCEQVQVEFMSSPFSLAAVDLLESLDIKRYKIGSGEVSNLLMLEKIARTGKPVILSSGMSSFSEIEEAVEVLRHHQCEFAILQCTTQYPTPPEQTGLNVIAEFKRRFQCPVGLSDHSGTIFPSLAAVALGAEIIEVHGTFDRRMFGPDSSSSLTPDEIKQMVTGIRFLEQSLNHPIDKERSSSFDGVKNIFEKSLATNKDLIAGHILQFEDLESKKPAKLGIAARDYQSVIGRKLRHALKRYSFITQNDIE